MSSSIYPVPLSGIQETIVDAKGDIIAATAADVVSRLAVGANDTVLMADSSTATGLKWGTITTGPTFIGCTLYKSANQAIPNDTWDTITFDSELFDTDGFHSTSSNTSRITIPSGKAGKYLIIGNWVWDAISTQYETYLGLNGSLSYMGPQTGASSGKPTSSAKSWILNLAVGDYLELRALHKYGSNVNILGTDDHTQFSVQYLGA
jgi:hypothetical protein